MSTPIALDPQPRPRTRVLFQVTAVLATLIVTMGAINSATGSGFACPTWPGCYPGHFGPEAEVHDLIEFCHRIVAALVGPALLACIVVGMRLPKAQRFARILPWLALVGAIAAAVFGMFIVKNHGIAKHWSVLDLLGALTCLIGTTLTSLSVNRGAPRWQWTRLSKLATGCLAALVLMHELGIVVGGQGSFTPVLGWPMWQLVGPDDYPALQVIRMLMAAGIVLALVVLTLRSWHHRELRTPLVVIGVAFVVEMVLGRVIATQGTEFWFAIGYCTAAVAILSATTIIAGRTALDGLEG